MSARRPETASRAALLVATLVAASGVAGAQGLGRPTAVSASDRDYRDRVAVTWDAIRGATAYRLFRNTTTDPATARDLGTTASWVFLDRDPSLVPGQTYHYWVRAEAGTSTSALGGPDAGVVAVAGPPGPVPPLALPPEPAGNAVTAAKVSLGKLLYWDEQLSSTGTVACGSCHQGARGGTDPRSIRGSSSSTHPGSDGTPGTPDDVTGSPGVPLNLASGHYGWETTFGMSPQVTSRKARAALDAGYSRELFWDGRAMERFVDPVTGATVLAAGAALESQSTGPPVSAVEMAHVGRTWSDVAAKAATARPLAIAGSIPAGLETWIGGRDYTAIFQEAFGSPGVTPARVAMAIASYERTLSSDRTPFDRLNAGISQLPPNERAGLDHFVRVGCASCHAGPLLSDDAYHYIGVRPPAEDLGRFAVTADPGDRGSFRTVGLRNVGRRSALMHTGGLGTIADVVEFYDRGGDFDAPNKDPRIRPLNLTSQQKAEIAAFLASSLTDARAAAEQYPFDRPALYAESGCVPRAFGTGRAGSGAHVPEAVTLEPPLIGNGNFTVGIARGLGGARATLVVDAAVPPLGSTIPPGSFARAAVNLTGQGAGAGFGSIVIAIPANPFLQGKRLFGRWYVEDPGAPQGLAASRPFRITLFSAYSKDGDGDGTVDVCEVPGPIGPIEALQ